MARIGGIMLGYRALKPTAAYLLPEAPPARQRVAGICRQHITSALTNEFAEAESGLHVAALDAESADPVCDSPLSSRGV